MVNESCIIVQTINQNHPIYVEKKIMYTVGYGITGYGVSRTGIQN
jgi:hypothetical protein